MAPRDAAHLRLALGVVNRDAVKRDAVSRDAETAVVIPIDAVTGHATALAEEAGQGQATEDPSQALRTRRFSDRIPQLQDRRRARVINGSLAGFGPMRCSPAGRLDFF